MPLMAQLAALEQQAVQALKLAPEATVECLGVKPAALVRKTYYNRGLRYWQSFGRRSRAQREHDNLLAVARTGANCTVAIGWYEHRRWGMLKTSTLVTRYLPDSVCLKQVLVTLCQRLDYRQRCSLAAGLGHLLATLHRGGFLWGAPMPRNVLVLGEPSLGRLAVCDTPAGIDFGRNLHGSRSALLDLFDAVFSPSRCRDWTRTERLRVLRAYTDGHRVPLRRLWHQLSRRPRWWHDCLRAQVMFWYGYLLQPLLRRVSMRHKTTR